MVLTSRISTYSGNPPSAINAWDWRVGSWYQIVLEYHLKWFSSGRLHFWGWGTAEGSTFARAFATLSRLSFSNTVRLHATTTCHQCSDVYSDLVSVMGDCEKRRQSVTKNREERHTLLYRTHFNSPLLFLPDTWRIVTIKHGPRYYYMLMKVEVVTHISVQFPSLGSHGHFSSFLCGNIQVGQPEWCLSSAWHTLEVQNTLVTAVRPYSSEFEI